MTRLFSVVLEMSLTGSAVIGIVLLLRLAMKRAPGIFSYALWAAVLFRLLCPVSVELPFALIEQRAVIDENYALYDEPITLAGAAEAAYQAVGDALNGGLGIQHIRTADQDVISAGWWDVWPLFFGYVWAIGAGVMLIVGGARYLRLRRKLVGAVKLRDNIYLADNIPTPFVLGLLRGRIYLPSSLSEEEQEPILLHERHHIRRLDPLFRLLAYMTLCLHWFNPLVWLAFSLSGRDMEISCDEAVTANMGADSRADYAALLLRFASGRRTLPAPLAFGEGDTSVRVKRVFGRRPGRIAAAIAGILLAAALLLLCFNRAVNVRTTLSGAIYEVERIVYDAGDSLSLEDAPDWCVTADFQLYERDNAGEDWEYMGALTPYPAENVHIAGYTAADARILENGDGCWLVAQTTSGETLLGGGIAPDNLQVIYVLRSTFYEHYIQVNFFQRSLVHPVGSAVQAFATWESDNNPGWLVVGFVSGEGFADMGFAVFRSDGGEGYRLMEHHVYPGAADGGITFASPPAVLDEDGRITDQTAYDVILSCNDQLDTIVRVLDDGSQLRKSADRAGKRSMTLLHWADTAGSQTVEIHYYDEFGQELTPP